MRSLTHLVLGTISLILAGQTMAASCWHGNAVGYCGGPFLASQDNAWAARQTYCGNNLWQTESCYVNDRVSIEFTNPDANNQQICWDALEDIIEQCERGDYATGNYEYNGAYYTMYFCDQDTCGSS
ncbi:hypothetical protein MVEN_01589200 [Mycena venus]|uniref:Uncharacterized protein n=1 Tax=Mycena venus TaxID=2733690 RepID=A0A8H6XSL5_9AGAR|nr:hypothetical protein MVEN_01589200 [Mycena venus]